ncbi:hypothetical protein BKI52_36705 [marine bacterium AO1-C]|nr:hypothetical protein BKI52_36705 [marine bacterium AO1-C]
MRWGKITTKEWNLTQCDYDTLAEAVILQSIGEIEFFPGRPVRIRHHIRIKILSKEGLKWANVSIPYYFKDNQESILGLKAQTINATSGRKPAIIKVRGSQIFTEKSSNLYKVKKFALPNVSVGSIIEYKYDLVTRSVVSLEGWTFQDEIPTLYSRFKAKIGVNADYVVVYQGERLDKKYNRLARNDWELQNLPALRKEPFTNNRWDYAEKIEFQLKGYNKVTDRNAGTTKYVELMSTWPKLVKDVLDISEFAPFKRRRFPFAQNILQGLNLSGLSSQEQIEKIYNKVRDHFVWDEYYRLAPRANLKKLWREQSASGAGINLWLATLLKNAGLQAFPVLISTKSHGKVLVHYPLLSKFNHLIAAVRVGTKYYLLDAKDKGYPYQVLPEEDLNGVGLTLESGLPGWIPLKSKEFTRSKAFATVDLTKGKASLSLSWYGQEAYEKRKHLASGKHKNIVPSKITLGTEEISLSDVSTENQSSSSKPLQIKATYKLPETPDLPNILYIKPVLWNAYISNPFKSPQRFYPIDFNYPFEDTYILTLTIPEGYKMESLPKNIKATTPNGAILFTYQAQVLGNRLQLLTKVKVLQVTIHHQYYGGVKELFSRIVEKHQEMIVLKKVNEK